MMSGIREVTMSMRTLIMNVVRVDMIGGLKGWTIREKSNAE